MKRAVIDTGLLVEILEGSPLGKKLVELLTSEEIEGYVTDLTLTEIAYVICRKYGMDKAKELVGKLLETGYFEVVEALNYAEEISKIKCEYSISFMDAAVVATAKGLNAIALFKREKELEDKRPEGVVFLDEL